MSNNIRPYTLDKKYKIWVLFYGEDAEPQLIMSYDDKAFADKCCLAMVKKKSYVLRSWVAE